MDNQIFSSPEFQALSPEAQAIVKERLSASMPQPEAPKNPPWKENVHRFSSDFLPMAGAAAMTAPTVMSGAGIPLSALAGGTGYAAGKEAAAGLDKLIGYQKPQEDETTYQKMSRIKNDILGGAVGEISGQMMGAAGGKALDYVGGKIGLRNWAPKAVKDYTKAIHPAGSRAPSAPQYQEYARDVEDAVSTIVNMRDEIQLADKAGHLKSGRVPTNLGQFAEAIYQAKNKIFEKYNNMMLAAHGKGIEVDLNPVADRLESLVTPALQTESPNTAKYALKKAAQLREKGTYSLPDLQEAVKFLNTELTAYEKNPQAFSANRLHVVAEQARAYRDALEQYIEGAEGPGYRDLRNKYKSLKSIEKEVSTRHLSEAGKGGQEQIDIYDIYSASMTLGGIVSMNPTALVRAAAVEGLKRVMKTQRDPNKRIGSMFEDVLLDELHNQKILAKQKKPPPVNFEDLRPTLGERPALPSGQGTIPMGQSGGTSTLRLESPEKVPVRGREPMVGRGRFAQEAGTEGLVPPEDTFAGLGTLSTRDMNRLIQLKLLRSRKTGGME